MTRAFVAVQPPERVLDAIDAAGAAMSAAAATAGVGGGRWSTRAQHHLTLQFLGNRADVEAVAAALAALAVGAGEVRVGGVGAFPNARRGRVLWAGLRDGAPFLAQLAAAVGVLLAPLGHEPEDREYRPHVTLGRWKQPTDLRPIIAPFAEHDFGGPWRVGEVVLYESVLGRDGPSYVERATIALAG